MTRKVKSALLTGGAVAVTQYLYVVFWAPLFNIKGWNFLINLLLIVLVIGISNWLIKKYGK